MNVTVAREGPTSTFVIPGASDEPDGDTVIEGAEGKLVPIALVAVITNEYAIPLRRPVTDSGDCIPLALLLSGMDKTVNDVTGDPPSTSAGSNVIVAEALAVLTAVILGV